MRLLAGLCLLGWLCAMTPTSAESRSILQSIPGVELLQDLTKSTVDGLSTVFSSLLGSATVGRALAGEQLNELADFGVPDDPDTSRNVSQIIMSRGFHAEEYDVVTKDGYILTIQRIVNPLVAESERAHLKPVILQHGLMSSSVDWVINSMVVRPVPYPHPADYVDRYKRRLELAKDHLSALGDSQEVPNSLGFYLANHGYDVFLANSRGNIYGKRHVNLTNWEPKFWSFTFDEQIAYDLPDTIEFVQKLTGHRKLAYVGHSQGTTMIFGLLAERPEYADFIEPVVALAPVAFVKNCISPVKYFAVYTPLFQNVNLWFGTSNAAVKYLAPIVCGPKVVRRDICENIFFLSVGFDEAQLDETRLSAYLAHMPSGTSVKNVAHWGQMVLSGRFAKFDHGLLGNQIEYKQTRAPDYELGKIRSKSLVLFHARNDWLASPKDVHRLEAALPEAPYKSIDISALNAKWNHIDFLYGKSCGQLVNTRVVELFDQFRANTSQQV